METREEVLRQKDVNYKNFLLDLQQKLADNLQGKEVKYDPDEIEQLKLLVEDLYRNSARVKLAEAYEARRGLY